MVFGASFMQKHLAVLLPPRFAEPMSISNEVKSMFTPIVTKGNMQSQSLWGCIRSYAGRLISRLLNTCPKSGSWAIWFAKKKEDAKELEERETLEREQARKVIRQEQRRREETARSNNTEPSVEGPAGASDASGHTSRTFQ